VIGSALVCSPHALPHHAFAQTFIFDKVIRIEGRIVEFLYRNPHSVIHVEVQGENGHMAIWAVEWAGAGQLSRQGIEKDTLTSGDHVIITGNPSRKPTDRRVLMLSLTRPSDAWRWAGGSQ